MEHGRTGFENSVRRKLLTGELSVGCSLGLGSPNVAEMLSHVGFEWLIMETEHNALDISGVEQMLMAVGNGGAVPLVRIQSASPEHIQRVLDIGAMGVM